MRRGQIDYRSKGDIVSVLSKTSNYGNKTKGKDSGTYKETIESRLANNPLTAHNLQTLA